MVEEGLKDGFARDVVLLKYVGMRPVIVHGGGPQITSLMERMGKKAEFVNGHRVTDSETMEIVEMVLCGKVNKEIVNMINRHGAKAVGLSGVDGGLIQVTKHKEEIGLVGDVKQIDPGIIDSLDQEGFVPVIASLGVGEDDRRYNVNADLVAGEMASSLKAIKLVILTDIKGILDKRENLISTIRVEEIEGLIEEGVVSGGMIPKLRACEIALRGGVKKAHIIDGRIHHSLLLELFTDEGIGTQVIP
jgi:acetylglutamate kinase